MLYISETSLDFITGYSVHTMKSVDNLANIKKNVKLYVPNFTTSAQKIKVKYNLYNLNKIKIYKSYFKNYDIFFNRIIFGIGAALFAKRNQTKNILTRSAWVSIFLIFFKLNHILEIHSITKGLSNLILIKLGLINSKYINKIVVINRELIKYLRIKKKKIQILPDAVDLRNFKGTHKRKYDTKKILYYGSIYDGRGIDLIHELGKEFKNIKFHMYGYNFPKLESFISTNTRLFGRLKYSEIPNLLRKYDFVMIPYGYNKGVSVNSKNLNTLEYMSPLKMFETLSMGNIILSSNVNALKKILKNEYNSIIVKNNTFESWCNLIKGLERKKNFKKISKNAIKTAKKFTWEKRLKKIFD